MRNESHCPCNVKVGVVWLCCRNGTKRPSKKSDLETIVTMNGVRSVRKDSWMREYVSRNRVTCECESPLSNQRSYSRSSIYDCTFPHVRTGFTPFLPPARWQIASRTCQFYTIVSTLCDHIEHLLFQPQLLDITSIGSDSDTELIPEASYLATQPWFSSPLPSLNLLRCRSLIFLVPAGHLPRTGLR